jgi:hypothetical protein
MTVKLSIEDLKQLQKLGIVGNKKRKTKRKRIKKKKEYVDGTFGGVKSVSAHMQSHGLSQPIAMNNSQNIGTEIQQLQRQMLEDQVKTRMDYDPNKDNKNFAQPNDRFNYQLIQNNYNTLQDNVNKIERKQDDVHKKQRQQDTEIQDLVEMYEEKLSDPFSTLPKGGNFSSDPFSSLSKGGNFATNLGSDFFETEGNPKAIESTPSKFDNFNMDDVYETNDTTTRFENPMIQQNPFTISPLHYSRNEILRDTHLKEPEPTFESESNIKQEPEPTFESESNIKQEPDPYSGFDDVSLKIIKLLQIKGNHSKGTTVEHKHLYKQLGGTDPFILSLKTPSTILKENRIMLKERGLL